MRYLNFVGGKFCLPTMRSENVALMKTKAFSQNVGKVFLTSKLVSENSLSHLCLRTFHWNDFV